MKRRRKETDDREVASGEACSHEQPLEQVVVQVTKLAKLMGANVNTKLEIKE